MNARCKNCGRIHHFGGRGTRLKELRCCGQTPEQVFPDDDKDGNRIWRTRDKKEYPFMGYTIQMP